MGEPRSPCAGPSRRWLNGRRGRRARGPGGVPRRHQRSDRELTSGQNGLPPHEEMPMTPDFKVADLSLAAFGRKEIQLAEHEMPGLMAMRREYGGTQPLGG